MTDDEGVMEKQLEMGFGLRSQLAAIAAADRPPFWLSLVVKIETKLTAKPVEMALICERLRHRDDADGQALLAYAESLLVDYGEGGMMAFTASARPALDH